MRTFLICLLALAPASAARAKAPRRPVSAQQLVAAADAIRNPQKPFRMTQSLAEYVSGEAQSELVLTVFAKENAAKQFLTLAMYREPARDAGKIVLFNATKLWLYDPAAKASVRLSPQQRLIGQASVGDVLAVNLAHDYRAVLAGEETLADADRVAHAAYRLTLTAAADTAIYGRIDYWVERDSGRPIKGKFYSDSGRLLKIAYYHRYARQLGVMRPTETLVIDGMDPKRVTTVTTSDYHLQDLPNAMFQRDYLPRVKAP